MACMCNHKERSTLTRIRELAKLMATEEKKIYVIVKTKHAGYSYCPEGYEDESREEIVEYVHYL